MNESSSSNAPATAATPASAAPNTPPVSESDYLRHQAEIASHAAGEALQGLFKSLGSGFDPRRFAKKHPWITLGGAAAGGFVAVNVLYPSQQRQALRQLKALEKAFRSAAESQENGREKSNGKSTSGGGIFSTVAAEALKALRPTLMTLLSNGFGNRSAPPESNGADTSASVSVDPPAPASAAADSEAVAIEPTAAAPAAATPDDIHFSR